MKRSNVFLALLILVVILVAGSTISITLICCNKRQPPKPVDAYLSNSKTYYCHLTMYPDLCYESMSSKMPNTTLLEWDPSPIFWASIQIAIDQLKNIASTDDNHVENLSKCGTWVHDSMGQLNESLTVLGVDSEIGWLTNDEMKSMKGWAMDAAASAMKCVLALDGEEKLGVEKARKCIVNSIGLMESRDSILHDFYNPVINQDDGYYDLFSYEYFEYRFLICLYSSLHLFLGLLYFLFWHNN